MNKSDLVEVLARKTDITLKKSEDVVNTVFDVMSEALVSGGRIEIRGFGSFVNKSYKSYKGRNPKTKETIDIPPKRLPFFKVGKELRRRVNGGSAAGAA
jgi:integration host factor subunit beta